MQRPTMRLPSAPSVYARYHARIGRGVARNHVSSARISPAKRPMSRDGHAVLLSTGIDSTSNEYRTDSRPDRIPRTANALGAASTHRPSSSRLSGRRAPEARATAEARLSHLERVSESTSPSEFIVEL